MKSRSIRLPEPAPLLGEPNAVLLGALAFEVAIATIDVITGNRIITNFFLLAPLALAASGTPRQVLIAGALALVLVVLSGIWDDYFLTLDHVLRVGVVSIGFVLGLVGARNRRRTEALVARLGATQEQLNLTLGALAEAVTVHDETGQLTFLNPAALGLFKQSSMEEALAADPSELFAPFEARREDGTRLTLDDLTGRGVLRGERSEPLLARWLDRDSGQERWLVVKASQYRDDRGRALAVNVIEDVTETKESELRERFLAHAGEMLSSSLEFEDTLQRVARLAVPELADWCGVELVDEHGESRQVAVAHVDPAKVEFATALREQYPPDPDATSGVPAVLRTGQAELYRTITDELLVAGARDEEHLRLSRELHMRSAMIVPMRARESVIGAITFVAAETKGAYDEQDLAFAQELASRAATAVENARIYHERSQTAETLQRSLLPSTLPSLPGWRAATLYRPADQVSHIGGDFFDLFRAADGFTVVLGDVTGKGVTAAAVTALARHSTKTAALLGLSPAGILRLLNRTLLDEPDLSLLTVVCAHVSEHRDRVEMTIASGGHPLPLRRRAGEHPVALGATGVLLGVDSEGDWPETAWVIEPGDTLLFYTDGVIDTPGIDARFGETRLQNLLADSSRDPDGLLAYIDAALREYQVGTHVDDTAMLALQFIGEQLPPSAARVTGRAVPVADPPRH